MASSVEDDLVPEQTEGFKVGEQKTIDEYQKLGRQLSSLPALFSQFAPPFAHLPSLPFSPSLLPHLPTLIPLINKPP